MRHLGSDDEVNPPKLPRHVEINASSAEPRFRGFNPSMGTRER